MPPEMPAIIPTESSSNRIIKSTVRSRRKRLFWPIIDGLLLFIGLFLLFGGDVVAGWGIPIIWSCRTQTLEFDAQVRPLLSEWQQSIDTLGILPPMAARQELLHLNRVAERTKNLGHPNCAKNVYTFLITEMTTTIRQLEAAHQHNPLLVARQDLDRAATLADTYRQQIDALVGR